MPNPQRGWRVCADASRLVGPNPSGPLRACSLAVRAALHPILAGGSRARRLVVGLSGGADSLALALVTIDAASRAGVPVVTVTVDHGLRPGSRAEAESVAELARSLGADAIVEAVTVPSRGAGGPEAAARDARRAALRAIAVSEHAPVLLGHTMEDQAETVLLRLARGAGPSSLRAIAPLARDEAGVTWLRPLLGLRRADTAGACAQVGLTPVEDPTNAVDGPWRAADGSPLRRSALRHRALPALASALGMDPVPALARSAQLCADDDDALRQWARQLTRGARSCDAPEPGPSGVSLSVSALAQAPRAVRARAVREAASRAGLGSLSLANVEAVDGLVVAWRGQGPIHLPSGSASRVGRGAEARLVLSPRAGSSALRSQ